MRRGQYAANKLWQANGGTAKFDHRGDLADALSTDLVVEFCVASLASESSYNDIVQESVDHFS